MPKTKKLSEPRRRFLEEAAQEGGVYAVAYYPPCKWAIAEKLVERRHSKWHITERGRAVLAAG